MAMVEAGDLVGTGEASKILGLTDARIGQLRRAGQFPEPVHQVMATPLWLAPDLVKWNGERVKGKPGRPRKQVTDVPTLAGRDHSDGGQLGPAVQGEGGRAGVDGVGSGHLPDAD